MNNASLATPKPPDDSRRDMLTGNQIRTLRVWAGIKTQAELGRRAGKLSRATIARAEEAGDNTPGHLSVDNLLAIARVFEEVGAQFSLPPGEPLTGGLHIQYPPKAKPLPPLPPDDDPPGGPGVRLRKGEPQ